MTGKILKNFLKKLEIRTQNINTIMQIIKTGELFYGGVEMEDESVEFLMGDIEEKILKIGLKKFESSKRRIKQLYRLVVEASV